MLRAGDVGTVRHLRGDSKAAKGGLRAAITKTHVAAKAAVLFARPRRRRCAGWFGGRRAESRSGQIRDTVVRGQLRGVSSQRAWSRQGSLPCPAIPVPAGALRDQFEHGRGACFLSRLGRHQTKQPTASHDIPAAQTGAIRVIELRSSGNYRSPSPRRFNNAASLTTARPPLWRPSGSGRRQGE